MWTAIALACLLHASAPGAEPVLPTPLTLEAAEDIFRAHGLDLLIAEAQVQGAEGDLRAAEVVQNPTLSASFVYGFPIGGPTDSYATPAVPGWGAGLSDNAALADVLSGKRGLRIDVAQKALEAARLSRADAERTLRTQLRTAFAQALLAQANLDFATQVLESYAESRRKTQLRYDKGDITQADLSRMVVASLEAEQAQAQARSQVGQAKAAVAFLLGSRSHALDLTLAGELSYRPLAEVDGAPPDALVQRGLERRPDVRAATATREQLALAVAQAQRQRVPDVSLNVGYSQQYLTVPNGVVGPPTLSVGFSAPLPVFYQQQGEIQRAEANLRAAELQEAKARAQVVADVSQAYAAYVAARELVKRMERELLAASKTARDLEQLMYQKGAASLLDFLDAERTFIATNLEYRQDLESYWAAVYALEQATGSALK